MNSPNRTLYLLVAALVLVGCGRVETAARRDMGGVKVERAWPASELRELRVTEVDGSITIEATERDTIALVATARGNFALNKSGENQGLFETELEGDTLRIGRRDHRRRKMWEIPFLFGRSRGSIDYVLEVPSTVAVSVRTVNGRIVTKGTDAPTDAVTVNGAIEIDTTGNHELKATSVNGRVRARFHDSFQGARFKTVNGRVQATLPESASFTVNLSQVNGDFEAAFPLSIRSSPGSRRVSGEVNGGAHELRIVTVNGDVELARLGDSR